MLSAWSEVEIIAIVEDYFSMLQAEIKGINYNKTAHRKKLIQQLTNRSHSSIERKHQNISAVLIEMGCPYISGYKPLRNYQRKLFPDIISELLSQNILLLNSIAEDADLAIEIPTVASILNVLVNPPEPVTPQEKQIALERPQYKGKLNYLAREAANAALGSAGERFIINYEHARLIYLGKENLADRVERISETEGDHAGFDILSFDETGKDRYIEVKTTKYGKQTPFFVSSNELDFSKQNSEKYHLYRLFQFRKEPKLFTLQGYLENNFRLAATTFRAECV
ncbi:hypothetical protein DRQ25_15510 [Candidatus Fermentibacteria bacterium]|nr:MAG: hypothetical protein DRQ25_15510 [Candidatus Fermentibacteria bacterium]